jgi:hypothetical protein
MKKLACYVMFFLLAVSLFSLEFDVIKSLDHSEFPLTHSIDVTKGDEQVLELLPAQLSRAEHILQRFSELQPVVTVEKLYRVPLGMSDSVNTRELFLKLANIFGNPETQTKYIYDSRWLGEVPLIEEAYICNERGRKASPLSFSPSDIPGTFEYYQYADEAQFAGVVMKVSLDITDQYCRVTLENANSLKFGIFSLVPKESIYVENVFFVDDNVLYVYSIVHLKRDIIRKLGTHTIKPVGMFNKRMDVMANWIAGELAQ